MPETTQDQARVSTLELFFDLVFVFVVTQLAHVLEQPGTASVGHALLELFVVYWMYSGFAWLTNTLASTAARQRTFLLPAAAVMLLVAMAVPDAFGADALLIALSYLALTALHLAGFVLLRGSVSWRSLIRLGTANLAAAALLLVAVALPEEQRWLCWVAAVVVQWVPASLGVAGAFSVNTEHFAERHGLMVIIVLGESLLSAATAHQGGVHADSVVGALAGLVVAACLWWCYFDRDDVAAGIALADRHRGHGRVALLGYDFTHVLMLGGVVAIAAGSREAAHDFFAPIHTQVAAYIGGGAATYLLGLALFRWAIGHAEARTRMAGALATVLTIPVGTAWGAAPQLAAVAAVVILMLGAEHGLDRRRAGSRR